MLDFVGFGKIPRLNRDCVITEKIDGTNAQICITPEGDFLVGSRTRWITPEDDNAGFARWAYENKEELMKLGVGHHFGEWWGQKIQRTYGLSEKRFWLFNTSIWNDPTIRPACCGVVPILYEGLFTTDAVKACIEDLRANGSHAVKGWMNPEGVVVYHVAGNLYFKATLKNDESPKTLVKEG
jgi:RNA ligase